MRPRPDLLEVPHHQRLRPPPHERVAVEEELINDATSRGWDREVERHTAVRDRIQALLVQLDQSKTDQAELSERR